MTRSAQSPAPISQAENLVTVMGGTGRPDPGAAGDDVRSSTPIVERSVHDAGLLRGSLPPFAR